MIYLLIWLILISLILNVFDNYKRRHTKPKVYDVDRDRYNELNKTGELND